MSLYQLLVQPQLDRPVLVVALEGWIDAGLGGGAAMSALLSSIETEVVATFDSDSLLDHRSRRPAARIVDGVNSALSWPTVELRAGRDAAGHDVLALVGPEPDLRWHGFCDAVAELATSLGVRMVVGLGAFPAPVPHTRPAQLACTASTAELAAEVGFVPGTVEVPAGVQAAVERRCAEAGIPSMALWVRVPHYVAGMPYPEASAVLLEALGRVAGIQVDTAELRESAATARQRIDELIAQSEGHTAMVRQLEAQADAEAAGPGGDLGQLPSGDELAAELERFLRGEAQ